MTCHQNPSVTRYLSTSTLSLSLAFVVSLTAGVPAQTGGRTLTGTIDGAPYRVTLPPDWNGTLLVYEDGYRVGDRTVYVAPDNMEELLLSRGYGLAGSAFRVDGYNIQEGIEDTKALMSLIREVIGEPQRTILLGISGGAVRNNALLETSHGQFDAAIDACGVMAGTALFFDRALTFAVAYDAAFGWPAAWGSPGDLRDDLDFLRDVLPVFLPQLFEPANFGRFEFIRLASGLPIQGFYDGPANLFANMFFTTQARAELERKVSGPAAQNLDHTYRLTDGAKSYLGTFGVDAEALLAHMNAHTVYAAKPSARSYVENFASFNGRNHKPILSMHAIYDGLVTVDHESVYAALNKEAGAENLLLQVYTDGIGHCTFSQNQWMSAIHAMESWLATGAKPDVKFFPASQGFDPVFRPPVWPQPVR